MSITSTLDPPGDPLALRLVIAAQFVAMGLVRTYFGARGGKDTSDASAHGRSEPA